MGTISYTIPTAGSTLNSVADPQISTALQTLLTAFNGGIDAVNLSALLAQSSGVNQVAQQVKGAVSIATSESRTNVAYGTLTTPDQVTGIVLPTNGLIAVWYHATWQESVAGAARAAIFLGSNQLQVYQTNVGDGPGTQAAATNAASASKNVPLFSIGSGLGSRQPLTGSAADVTTGQALGSGTEVSIIQELAGGVVGGASYNPSSAPCYIFAAAGAYVVSVQFKASSGTVTASNRKLWVQAISFS